jgi:23S rRNA pseudouridine1911/1915/1917 synthase
LVHRLDKDTSGLMVVALNPEAQASLSYQLKARAMKRGYVALVAGQPRKERFVVDVPVGRDPASRRRMAAGPATIHAREARTRVCAQEYLSGFTLVEARLETGRTHQIRVHLAYIGHPVAGDITYGGPRIPGLSRQFLHAAELTVVSPDTGREMRFHANLPADLGAVLRSVRQFPHRGPETR